MITVRAALAVGLLGGYWLGRWLLPAGLAVYAVWLGLAGDVSSAVLVGGSAVLLAVLSVRAAVTLNECADQTPGGTLVPRRSDSPLWSELVSLCGQLDVRVPDEIRLLTEPTVEIQERPRRLGLAQGPRSLNIGLPLLVGLSGDQLRALVTHELAHGSREAGPLRPLCRRARTVVGSMIARRPAYVGVVFAAHARLFLAVESIVSRDQEYRADQAAGRLIGSVNLASALRELPVTATAWHRYVTEVITPALRSGYAPTSLTDGFQHTKYGWRGEMMTLRAILPEPTNAPWDAHPPLVERLHAINLAPEQTFEPDPVPCVELLRESTQTPVVREVERHVTGTDVRRVPWEEFSALVATESLRAEVAEMYQITGTADIDGVLALLESGGLAELKARLQPQAREGVRRLLSAAFAQAAVDGGVARWWRTLSGDLVVVRPDGGPIPVDELAARVIADSATVPMVREVLRVVRTGQPIPAST